MEKTLCSLDLNILKEMYERESSKLKEALLHGADWEAVRDQRHTVTELAIAIHQKRFPQNNNPAENDVRPSRRSS